ncbi:GNAT family N-acetyltransferase [Microbulbifer hainanensis]|uniref:GNAT family N-acetyltransferase n=1 Tax=Microbulbifer hainanensis TaxID=2735675 RepID=UPI001865C464|nr:GNAT family N-acetyltransferase [Microbulbifer hainanensis]
MSAITFRPCTPADADAAIPLIYSSGPAAFDYAFCDRHQQEAKAFLHRAFVRGVSEFGYRQHIAAILDDRLVGIGAVRFAEQNLPFTFAALRDIVTFYSPLAAARTVIRGLKTEQVIHPPRRGVGIVYHLGVAPECRSRGIGRQLVAYLIQEMRKRKLPTAALDVAATNPRALALYGDLGFTPCKTRVGNLCSTFGRVVDHTYMEYALDYSEQAATES